VLGLCPNAISCNVFESVYLLPSCKSVIVINNLISN